jgi:hypothetical protein
MRRPWPTGALQQVMKLVVSLKDIVGEEKIFLVFSINLAWNSQKETYLKEYLVLACTSVFMI